MEGYVIGGSKQEIPSIDKWVQDRSKRKYRKKGNTSGKKI